MAADDIRHIIRDSNLLLKSGLQKQSALPEAGSACKSKPSQSGKKHKNTNSGHHGLSPITRKRELI